MSLTLLEFRIDMDLKIVFAFLCVFIGAVYGSCPDEWIELDGSCYHVDFENELTWSEAQKSCSDDGGHLAKPQSQEENTIPQFLIQWIIPGPDVGFWIDGTDQKSEGNWVWHTGGESITFFDWEPNNNEPNGGENENCLKVTYVQESWNNTWRDDNCDAKHKYICEKEKEKELPTCPKGWDKYEDSCYLFQSMARTWSNAEGNCTTIGGHLAEPHTAKQNTDLKKFLKGKITDSVVGKTFIWIGGSDQDSEGAWKWSTTKREIDPQDWAPQNSEPNGRQFENCLTYMGFWGYHWNDANCDEKFPYICEKMINSMLPDEKVHDSNRQLN